jgi:hypothetical protein
LNNIKVFIFSIKIAAFQTTIAAIDAFVVNFTALPVVQPQSLTLTPDRSPEPVIPANNIQN